jgi:hypothetical protein
MPSIFISYRRSDSNVISGRIYDRLKAAFGAKNIFKDIDNIPLGKDFRGVLREATANCSVMLVIIGPNWITATDNQGYRRLHNPNDFVRLEVETGLQRDSALVIPVLVGGADMPRTVDLPETLRELTFNNAAVVGDDPNFHRDMDRLIEKLRSSQTRLPLRGLPISWGWVVAAIIIPLLAALITILPSIWDRIDAAAKQATLTPTTLTLIQASPTTPSFTTSTSPVPTATSTVVSQISKPTVTIISPQDGNQVDTPSSSTNVPNDEVCRLLANANLMMLDSWGHYMPYAIPEGTLLAVTARLTDNSWWMTNYNNQQGWLSGQSVNISGNCANITAYTSFVSNMPDLAISQITGSVNPVLNGNGQITELYGVTIVNNSQNDASQFTVTLRANDMLEEEWTVSGLAAGQSILLTTNVMFKSAGSFVLRVDVDTANIVVEASDVNNTGFQTVTVANP